MLMNFQIGNKEELDIIIDSLISACYVLPDIDVIIIIKKVKGIANEKNK